jgi:hypothetical protein
MIARWFGTRLFQPLFPEFLSSIFFTSCFTSPTSNSEEPEIRKRVDGKFTKCRGDRGGGVMGPVWPDL